MHYITFNKTNGAEIGRESATPWPPKADGYQNIKDRHAVEAEISPGDVLIYQDTADQYHASGPLVATVVSGVITDIQPAPESLALWIHSTLTGGMQSPAGTLYLKNDGVDALAVHAELRDGPDPANSNAVTQIDGNDITSTWALELVNVDTRALADTPLVQMTAGVIDVSYTATIAPCELELAENRLQPIGGYQLKLAQPVRFKIARSLS